MTGTVASTEPTRLNLDELERDNTQAAIELDASWLREQAQMNNCHLLSDVIGELIVNSPPVTLALIARIRELEAALDIALDCWNTTDSLDNWRAEMDATRAILEKGVVLP